MVVFGVRYVSFFKPTKSFDRRTEMHQRNGRSDVYNRCLGEQFVFIGPVNGIAPATAKHGRIFFARGENRQMVCLYADRYAAPVNLPDGFPEVLSADWLTTRDEVAIGTLVHAVCVPVQGKDPRAIRWCLQVDFKARKEEICQIQDDLQHAAEIAQAERVEYEAELAVARVERQEAEFQMQKLLNEKRTADPRDYDEAILCGWVVVPGVGNGRQRILELHFSGEEKPRRITRHLPPSTVTKKPSVSRSCFAMV